MTPVFIHGNSSSKVVFDNQVTFFKNAIAEDLPGHGDQLPSSDPYNEYSVRGMCNALIQKYKSVENLVLLGNSLGGHLAMEIAPQLPNLKGLVIFGAPPVKKPLNVEEAFIPTEALAYYFKGAYDESELREKLQIIAHREEHFEMLLQDFMRTDEPFRDVWAKSVTVDLELQDEVEIVKNLNKPVYVIHGLQDPSVNLEYLKTLEGITKIYEIDDCGHYPSLEQPEAFNAIVDEILSELKGA